MEFITANLLTTNKPRSVIKDGREWLVVSAVSLPGNGVLSGSQGALFYPVDHVSRSTPAWNGLPLVGYHPITPNGRHVSAGGTSGPIWERQGLGVLRNTTYGPSAKHVYGRLKHEAWFDVERVRNFDARQRQLNSAYPPILPRLRSGQPIELSTGLFTKNVGGPGTSPYGRAYDRTAINYRPDHLAVLPDQVGACSLNDGCGISVNTRNSEQQRDDKGRWMAAVHEILQHTTKKGLGHYSQEVAEHLYAKGESPKVGAFSLVQHKKCKWQLPTANAEVLVANLAEVESVLAVNPFVSEKQRRYLWANEPEIAHAWAHGEHTSDKDHRMPSKTGKDVKGPLAKAERKAQKTAARKKEPTRNSNPEGHNQYTAASAKARALSLKAVTMAGGTEADPAIKASDRAIGLADEGNFEKAARAHTSAHYGHTEDAELADRRKRPDIAAAHREAAAAHKEAASLHSAHTRNRLIDNPIPLDVLINSLYVLNEDPIIPGWVTMDGGQHVYIGPHGDFLPRGPSSRPIKEAARPDLAAKARKEGRVPGGPKDPDRGEAGHERGDRPAGGKSEAAGGRVAREAEGSGTTAAGEGRQTGDQPTRQETAASLHEVNGRFDAHIQELRNTGQHEFADFMEEMKGHINEMGTQAALDSLGKVKDGGGRGKFTYEAESGHGENWSMPEFTKNYLEGVGIHPVAEVTGGEHGVISSVSPEFRAHGKGQDPYVRGDFIPKDPTFKDKLEEAKHLPGLEKSEDLGKLFGRRVDHLGPEEVAKLDDHYGKGQWIVKPYNDDAYAGHGIFFPQRVEALSNNDPSGKGPALLNRNGEADGSGFMAQPAFKAVGISDEERARGVTGAEGGKGEGRVHITTKNGVASIVPHSTWIKGESFPVVFEDDNTRSMAKAALDAINALPASERQGQIYAPDVMPTAHGHRVVEANPANRSGSSGYLGDNPYIIDSYVSHLTGQVPAHVKFMRDLLSKRDTTQNRRNTQMKKRLLLLNVAKALGLKVNANPEGHNQYSHGSTAASDRAESASAHAWKSGNKFAHLRAYKAHKIAAQQTTDDEVHDYHQRAAEDHRPFSAPIRNVDNAGQGRHPKSQRFQGSHAAAARKGYEDIDSHVLEPDPDEPVDEADPIEDEDEEFGQGDRPGHAKTENAEYDEDEEGNDKDDDEEDTENAQRCPECGGEMEDGECEECGYTENVGKCPGCGNVLNAGKCSCGHVANTWTQAAWDAAKAARAKTMSATEMRGGVSRDTATKMVSTAHQAVKAGEAGDSKKAMNLHGKVAKMHENIAKQADARNDPHLAAVHSAAAEAHHDMAAHHEMKLTGNAWSDSARDAAAASHTAHGASLAAGKTSQGHASAKAVGHANEQNHEEAADAHHSAAVSHEKEARLAPDEQSRDLHRAAADAHHEAARKHDDVMPMVERQPPNANANNRKRRTAPMKILANLSPEVRAARLKELRPAMLEALTANCGCETEKKGLILLNNETLATLVAANAKSAGVLSRNDKAEGSNADAQGSGDDEAGSEEDDTEDKNDPEWEDDVPSQLHSKGKGTMNQKQLNDLSMQMFGMPHSAVKGAVAFTANAEKQNRMNKVRRLIANVQDPEKRKLLANQLMKKSAAELDDMLLLLPQQTFNQDHGGGQGDYGSANYAGAAGGVSDLTSNAGAGSTDPELVMEPVTMNDIGGYREDRKAG